MPGIVNETKCLASPLNRWVERSSNHKRPGWPWSRPTSSRILSGATGGRTPMPTFEDVTAWRGRNLVDRDGDKIGSVEEVYVDRQSGEPEWLAVKTGLFGSKLSFVPLAEADASGDEVRVPYEKAQVKDSPSIESDGELSPEEESQLYRHYGRSYSEHSGNGEGRDIAGEGRDAIGETRADATTGRGTVGEDVSG